MDFIALDYFCKVAALGSVSTAAKVHNVAKSSISTKLRKLETELGANLFLREGHKQVLTDAGEEFYRHAQTLLRNRDLAVESMSNFGSDVRGTLRIASTGEFGSSFTGELLYAFRSKHPEIKLDLTFYNPSLVIPQERLHDFDVILSWGANVNDKSLLLTEVAFGLFAGKSYLVGRTLPDHPKELSRNSGVLYREPFGIQRWQLRKGAEEIEILPEAEFIANDYWTLKYLAICGEGIAYLPRFFTSYECSTGVIVDIFPEWSSDKKGIFLTRSSRSLNKVDIFEKFCLDFFSSSSSYPRPQYYVEALTGV